MLPLPPLPDERLHLTGTSDESIDFMMANGDKLVNIKELELDASAACHDVLSNLIAIKFPALRRLHVHLESNDFDVTSFCEHSSFRELRVDVPNSMLHRNLLVSLNTLFWLTHVDIPQVRLDEGAFVQLLEGMPDLEHLSADKIILGDAKSASVACALKSLELTSLCEVWRVLRMVPSITSLVARNDNIKAWDIASKSENKITCSIRRLLDRKCQFASMLKNALFCVGTSEELADIIDDATHRSCSVRMDCSERCIYTSIGCCTRH